MRVFFQKLIINKFIFEVLVVVDPWVRVRVPIRLPLALPVPVVWVWVFMGMGMGMAKTTRGLPVQFTKEASKSNELKRIGQAQALKAVGTSSGESTMT